MNHDACEVETIMHQHTSHTTSRVLDGAMAYGDLCAERAIAEMKASLRECQKDVAYQAALLTEEGEKIADMNRDAAINRSTIQILEATIRHLTRDPG